MTAHGEAHELLTAVLLGLAFAALSAVLWSWNMR
jgi:hypothetical protein